MLRERVRDREALEAEAGQEKARKRDLVRRQAGADAASGVFQRAPAFGMAAGALRLPVWRPSGYGQVRGLSDVSHSSRTRLAGARLAPTVVACDARRDMLIHITCSRQEGSCFPRRMSQGCASVQVWHGGAFDMSVFEVSA